MHMKSIRWGDKVIGGVELEVGCKTACIWAAAKVGRERQLKDGRIGSESGLI